MGLSLVLIAPTWLLGMPAPAGAAGEVIAGYAGDPGGAQGNAGDGGPATAALLSSPYGVAVDGAGNTYVADSTNHRIRKVSPGGVITNFAGSPVGVPGDSGNGGPATSALLTFPQEVATDAAGNVYITESTSHRVRRVDTSGVITLFAGSASGVSGNTGDGAAATGALLNTPFGVAADTAGNVYIADGGNKRIRRVDPLGVITNFAGSAAGVPGNSGDGGPATAALLGGPIDVATDSAGRVYIVDGNRVRRVDTLGVIANFAGSAANAAGNTGDGGPATAALLSTPVAVAVDGADHVYLTDANNRRVRRVGAGSGTITNFAGSPSGTFGNSGDGGPAASALLGNPWGLAATSSGTVYVADVNANRVREVASPTVPDPPTGVTATGSGPVTVAWTPPVDDGGSPITGFTVTASPGGATFTAGPSASSRVVTGLAPGTYTFTVVAANAAGNSLPSAASNPVTIIVAAPLSPPSAPLNAVAAGGSTAQVSWDPPASDGGSPITEYFVYATRSLDDPLNPPGNGIPTLTRWPAGTARSLTISGLAPGIYTFRIRAVNAVGLSPQSIRSNPVIINGSAPPPSPTPEPSSEARLVVGGPTTPDEICLRLS